MRCFCTRSLRSGMWPMLAVRFHQHVSHWLTAATCSWRLPCGTVQAQRSRTPTPSPHCPHSVLPTPASSPLEHLSHSALEPCLSPSCYVALRDRSVLLISSPTAAIWHATWHSGYTMNTHVHQAEKLCVPPGSCSQTRKDKFRFT